MSRGVLTTFSLYPFYGTETAGCFSDIVFWFDPVLYEKYSSPSSIKSDLLWMKFMTGNEEVAFPACKECQGGGKCRETIIFSKGKQFGCLFQFMDLQVIFHRSHFQTKQTKHRRQWSLMSKKLKVIIHFGCSVNRSRWWIFLKYSGQLDGQRVLTRSEGPLS